MFHEWYFAFLLSIKNKNKILKKWRRYYIHVQLFLVPVRIWFHKFYLSEPIKTWNCSRCQSQGKINTLLWSLGVNYFCLIGLQCIVISRGIFVMSVWLLNHIFMQLKAPAFRAVDSTRNVRGSTPHWPEICTPQTTSLELDSAEPLTSCYGS